MIRTAKAFGVFVVALGACLASAQTDTYAPGEVLVKFKGAITVASLNANVANKAIGAVNLKTIPGINVSHIKLPQGMKVTDAIAYYQRLSTVEYAEPNTTGKYLFAVNDPLVNQQYHIGITKCPEAWNLTKGSATVSIAIIDSGFDLTHEDMQGKFTAGWDFEDNDADPTFENEDHGVHCAGDAASATNNSKGVAAPGFNCKIMPLRLGDLPSAAGSAAALIFAADKGAKVASMSYAVGNTQTQLNAVNYAWGKGMVLLAAAGNSGVNVKFYPAAYDKVIAVGATNQQDLRADFSNFGPDWVDVGSPGVGILSTIPGGYAAWDGTSMATPVAAGVVGLLWSLALPGTTNTQIRAALESTTDPIGNGGFKFGRINAYKACSALDPGSATISSVTGVGIWTGAGSSGFPTDLTSTDAAFYTVTSASTSLGQVGGALVDIGFNGPATNLRESFASIEANGPAGSTAQFYLKNFQTGKFDLIKAVALQPTGTKREKIPLPFNLSKYVSGGAMQVGLRAIGPNRTPRAWGGGVFDFKIGFVQISTRVSNN
jgi:thermitase